MQVSLENLSDVERKLTIKIPSDQIENRVTERIKKAAKNIRVPGFRPGKVPLSEVKRRYGEDIRGEVIGDLMKHSLSEAISENKLKLVGTPIIESGESDPEANFNFTAKIEVYPEIKLADFKTINIEKPVAAITENDINDAIEGLRQQRLIWVDTEEPATKNNQVIIDFTGTYQGKPLKEAAAKDFTVVLGSNRLISGFEEGIVGMKSGETKTLELTFPENYHEKKLAGKQVSFTVTLQHVQKSQLPELNEEFFRSYGVEENSMEKFREEVKSNLEYEVGQLIKAVIKRRVFDALYQLHNISLPVGLVKQEIEARKHQIMHQFGQHKPTKMDLPDAPFEKEAKKRVALGLILREIIAKHAIKLDRDKVKEAIENTAKHYENPAEVINLYQTDQELKSQIESMVFEEEVVDFVLSQGMITDKTYTFQEVRNAYHARAE